MKIEFDKEKIKDFEFPLVVKPVDSYSSRGVRKVLDFEEAEKEGDENHDKSGSRKHRFSHRGA